MSVTSPIIAQPAYIWKSDCWHVRQSISQAPQHKEGDECQEIKTIEVSAAHAQLCTLQPPPALHYSIKPADCVSQSDGPGLDISTFHIKVLIFNLQTYIMQPNATIV